MIDAQTIHAQLGAAGWRDMLITLGVSETYLRKKNGPCPACGGEDRFSFDNRKGRGDFFCRQCSPGDGFQLLMRVHRWTFKEAHQRVIEAARLKGSVAYREAAEPAPVERAEPTRRVLTLLREACEIADCEPARRYLESRALWPLPAGARLQAHSSVEYWNEGKRMGRYAALIAPIRDGEGELVTAHVTYLTPDGRKLSGFEPRKILGPLTGHHGCAAPIMDAGPVLGIAEGIETALSAAKLSGIKTWAAVNAGLLAKFTPPPVERLVIFADRDVAGLEAASLLMQRLQGRVAMEIRTPRAKDWNDVLRAP